MRGLGRLLTWLGLIVGAVALVTQFTISMQAYAAAGRDIPGSLGQFFTFYTILTNITLVLIYLSELSTAKWLDIFRSLPTRGMMVAAMLLVMTFVHFFLRGLTPLTGLSLVCDWALHYAAPILYLLWWLVAVRHGPLTMRQVPVMLVPTFVYFLYVMARGAWVKEYPYPVLNAIRLGYGKVLLNAAYLTVGLGALCLIVIAIDELLARRKS
ncbi:MAG: Pr6Pr family membrane protein [Devosia sp.]|nr:Pr6Pr family membrane protein [Devosia sp.]